MNIGVLTTGGDAPGMNPAIRAVVRRANFLGWKVWGIARGFQGLYENDLRLMDHESVSGIINRGGTILNTIRCPDFLKPEFRRACYDNLRKREISGLVVIGGNGSLAATRDIGAETDFALAFIPASIDNDIAETEETIGFDTAVNTALRAIDKIRDTATSHQRFFLVEVMGRDNGFLPLAVGLAAGAEVILVPEYDFQVKEILDILDKGRRKGKKSMIAVVAEGAAEVAHLANTLGSHYSGEIRYSVLGYLQRGGAPSARSRELAFLFGARAVEALSDSRAKVLTAWRGGRIVTQALSRKSPAKKLNRHLLELAHILSS